MTATQCHPSIHLAASQLIEAWARCLICGNTNPRRAVGVIQRDPMIHLLACDRCGGHSASHMPRPQVLADYYAGYYCNGGDRIAFGDAEAFVRNILRCIQPAKLDTPLRILDFGGGDGTLGMTIAQRLLAGNDHREVAFTLVDSQPPSTHITDKRLLVTHCQALETVEGPFDLVLASAVLEHIPELQPMIQRLFKLLAPKGWFYARTPYVAPLKRLFPNFDLTYPGHVHDLGAPFWNRVAEIFQLPVHVVVSRPSIIETTLARAPLRTVAAWLVKLPARIELALTRSPRTPRWKWVGGWEVVLQKFPQTRDAAPAMDNSPARLQRAASHLRS